MLSVAVERGQRVSRTEGSSIALGQGNGIGGVRVKSAFTLRET